MRQQPPAFSFLLALVLVGCVAKGRHELVEVQLDATRAALSTSQASSRAEASGLAGEIAALESEVIDRENQLRALRESLTQVRAEMERLTESEARHVLTDLAQCPVPDPETGEVPEETPEAARRRLHIEASVSEVKAALLATTQAASAFASNDAHHRAALDAFQPLVDEDLAVVTRAGEETVVTILVAKLFNENRTSLSPLGVTVLEQLAPSLRQLPGHAVVVVGHTDNQPVHTAAHASNWELGFGYAIGVVRELEYLGVPVQPTASSAAGKVPIADNEDKAGRRLNRRVELRLTPDPDLLERALTPPEAPEEDPPEGG